MGLRFRKSPGTKHIKLNIGKNGFNSTTFKISKGITYNSKRGLTLGLPGTGISYNFGKKKTKNIAKRKILSTRSVANLTSAQRQVIYQQRLTDMRAKTEVRKEYNSKFKEFTGGYNKKAIIAIIISIILCLTPLWPLGLLLAVPSLFWFIVDTILKIIRFNKHLKEDYKNV